MIIPETLIADVNFTAEFNPNALRFNSELGFLEVDEAGVAVDSLRLLGFGVPIARQGGFDRSDVVRPLTEFRDLPPAEQSIDHQGKGVGPRLYNVRAALAGAWSKPDAIGVYTFDISPARLLDGRQAQGGKIARLARHAGRIARSKLVGVEAVVAGIHDSYGDADAVELEMPPLPQARQAVHGVKTPTGVTPQFIIVRNPAITLRKVGETNAPW